MAQEKGMVTTCDRCGAYVFSKLLGKEDFDGGYSSRDKFESLPEGWGRESVRGKYTILCTTCREQWLRQGRAFMGEPEKVEKV